MDDIKLTRESEKLLKILYRTYKKNRHSGLPRSEAADFGSSKTIHEKILPKWSFDDVDESCAELLRAGLLDGFRADGYVFRAYLSEKGIAFGQTSFVKNVPKLFGWVLELAQAIRSLLLG